MKKFLKTLILATMIAVLAACGGQEENNNNAEVNQNQVTEENNNEETENETEELTAQKVIAKASEASQEMKGMHYIMETSQQIGITDGEESETMDQDMSMETKMTFDPMTMHMDGLIKSGDTEMKMENYYVDGIMYTKSDPNPWIAVEGMGLEEMQAQLQGQDPAEMMDQFNEMIEEISAEEGGEDAFTMEEQDDVYVITMDLDEEASDKLMEIVKKQSEATFEQLEQAGLPNVMDDMKIKSIKQVLHIDKESFVQKKIDQQMEMEMTIEEAVMNINQDMTTDFQGEVTEEITVPAEIVEEAEVISADELQGAQEQ